MAKIVTVYTHKPQLHDFKYGDLIPIDMSYIRWYKISEALARLGHRVDMAIPDPFGEWIKNSRSSNGNNVRKIPLSNIKWKDYDVVKTLFDLGIETLESYGGINHPFIISKLGSVVGSEDMEGVYFYGDIRKKLYQTQEKINKYSKFVTVLTKPAKELWIKCFGEKDKVLLVPGGVEGVIPRPNKNPYKTKNKKKCLFAGNVYTKSSQPEANRVLIEKLNTLGRLLKQEDIKLYLLGPGDVSQLDKRYVGYLGFKSYEKTWDYLYFADVGIVVSAGKFMHNNESTKIYHYLRIGLPIVSERGFPNDYVITESKLGYIVENGNLEKMAQKIEEAAHRKDWDREYAINYILINHTWDKRVDIYDKIMKEYF